MFLDKILPSKTDFQHRLDRVVPCRLSPAWRLVQQCVVPAAALRVPCPREAHYQKAHSSAHPCSSVPRLKGMSLFQPDLSVTQSGDLIARYTAPSQDTAQKQRFPQNCRKLILLRWCTASKREFAFLFAIVITSTTLYFTSCAWRS